MKKEDVLFIDTIGLSNAWRVFTPNEMTEYFEEKELLTDKKPEEMDEKILDQMNTLRVSDLLVGDKIITEKNHNWIVLKKDSDTRIIVCKELEDSCPNIDWINSLIKETRIEGDWIKQILRPISTDYYLSDYVSKYNIIYDHKYITNPKLKDKAKKLKSLAKEMIKILKELDK